MNRLTSLILISSLFFCSSCVSKKKYLIAENGRLSAIERGEKLRKELSDCKDENSRQTLRIDSLLTDTTELGGIIPKPESKRTFEQYPRCFNGFRK